MSFCVLREKTFYSLLKNVFWLLGSLIVLVNKMPRIDDIASSCTIYSKASSRTRYSLWSCMCHFVNFCGRKLFIHYKKYFWLLGSLKFLVNKMLLLSFFSVTLSLLSSPKIAAKLHSFIKYKTIFSKRMLLLWYNYEKLILPKKVITGIAESTWILWGFCVRLENK